MLMSRNWNNSHARGLLEHSQRDALELRNDLIGGKLHIRGQTSNVPL